MIHGARSTTARRRMLDGERLDLVPKPASLAALAS